MKYKAINQLIEKYFEGLTNLEEEALLREYFEQSSFIWYNLSASLTEIES